MELQIQDLVASIRKDGIDAANSQAEAIIAEAKRKAEAIIADAKLAVKSEKESAVKEIDLLKESAVVSAQQAKRDAMLAFKEEVTAKYEKILAGKIQECLGSESLGILIRAAVVGEDISQYAAEVSEVTDVLKNELAKEIKDGLEIRPSKQVKAGFRLTAKDGSGYFDCSDDEIMQMLMPYFRDLDL